MLPDGNVIITFIDKNEKSTYVNSQSMLNNKKLCSLPNCLEPSRCAVSIFFSFRVAKTFTFIYKGFVAVAELTDCAKW